MYTWCPIPLPPTTHFFTFVLLTIQISLGECLYEESSLFLAFHKILPLGTQNGGFRVTSETHIEPPIEECLILKGVIKENKVYSFEESKSTLSKIAACQS